MCEEQPGDGAPTPFSFLHLQQPGWSPPAGQVSCFGTRTTAASEALVLDCMASGERRELICVCARARACVCVVVVVQGARRLLVRLYQQRAEGIHGPGSLPPLCPPGRGAVFDSGMTVAQGGCVEPRYCPSLETKFR